MGGVGGGDRDEHTCIAAFTQGTRRCRLRRLFRRATRIHTSRALHAYYTQSMHTCTYDLTPNYNYERLTTNYCIYTQAERAPKGVFSIIVTPSLSSRRHHHHSHKHRCNSVYNSGRHHAHESALTHLWTPQLEFAIIHMYVIIPLFVYRSFNGSKSSGGTPYTSAPY